MQKSHNKIEEKKQISRNLSKSRRRTKLNVISAFAYETKYKTCQVNFNTGVKSNNPILD
jgi:hypothetical protein